MKKLLTASLFFLLTGWTVFAQTATVTPSATTYLATGGTVTFTVNLSYTGPHAALGFSIAGVPAGWTYGTTGGVNTPADSPVTGDTDNFGFFYISIPASPVSFTFSVNYPAGLTGNQTFSGITAIFRPTGGASAVVNVPSVTISPPALTAQTIAFSPLVVKTFGDASFALTATATSGLPVSYVSSNTTVVSIVGSTATIVGAGTANITASQPGNANFAPAGDVVQAQVVNPASQTIAFAALPDRTLGDAPFTLSATASSGLVVTFASSDPNVVSISGTTATVVGLGSATITASQAGNANYNAAPSLPQTQRVVAAPLIPQTITFAALTDRAFGDPQFALAATASSGLPVSYFSSNPNVVSIAGNIATITGAGTVNITASQAGNAAFASAPNVVQAQKINVGAQTITFAALSAKTFGDAPFALTATASSGLPVIYQSSNPGVISINGSIATIVGAGTANITAGQGGNANFAPAGNVLQAQLVNKANQTITFAALADKTVGDAAFGLTATSSSGLPVSFASSDPNVVSVSGTTAGVVGVGSATITASQAGNVNFNAAVAVPQTQKVVAAPLIAQTITFAVLPDKTFGAAPFALTATASSGLTVSFTSSNPNVISIAGNTATIVGAGTANITASQAGNATFAAAPDVVQAQKVNVSGQTIAFGALPAKTFGDASFALTATASSGLPVAFASSNLNVLTISGSTATIVGAGTANITVSQAGNANFAPAADVVQAQVVNKANQTIAFAPLPDKTVGDAAFALTATASSGLVVTFTSSDLNVVSINGVTATVVGAGSATITATQAGNANFNAAADEPQTQRVVAAPLTPQTITFAALADRTFGAAPFALTATASSGLTVSFTSSNPNVISIAGNTATIVGAGTADITASQAGNAIFAAAPNVVQAQKVNVSGQTIAFAALPAKTFGDAPFALTATASSGLPVTFASSNLNVLTISGSTATVVGAGTANVTASQAGNANFAPAADVVQAQVVNKANQTIAFAPLPDKTVGDAAFALTATASSGLVVTFTSSDLNVVSINGVTATVVGAGSATITAAQAGNANFNAATGVPQTQRIVAAPLTPQTITFAALTDKIFGGAPFALTATASSGLTVSFTSSNPNVISIAGNTATIVGAGTADITASQAGNAIFAAAANVVQAQKVNVSGQTIAFAALPAKTFGDAPFALTATASSGLPVTFASSNLNVLTISGSTATIVGAGTANITVSQAGNANFAPAADVVQAQVVNKANQTIAFAPLPDKTVGEAAFSLTATASSGLVVTFTSSDLNVVSINGVTATVVGAGSATITATQAGNANFNAAADVPQTQRVVAAPLTPQTITFAALADKTFGAAPFALTATASSGLTVSFTSSNPNVISIAGNTATIVGAGTADITASQAGNAIFAAAPNVVQAQKVNVSGQTIAFAALPAKIFGDAPFALSATASSGLPVTFASSNLNVLTISGSTATIVGAGTANVTASQAGNANFGPAADVVQAQLVNKANQTIAFAALPDKTVGDAAFALAATATSGLAVTFTSSDPTVVSISGTTATVVGVGSATITASQTGNANFNAALAVPQTQKVVAGTLTPQTIIFAALPDRAFGDAPFALSATASSGLPVSFASSNSNVVSIVGNTATIVGAGTTTITASQAGNATFAAAPNVLQAQKVNTAAATIALGGLAATYDGAPKAATTATTPTGLSVAVTYNGSATAPTNPGTYAVVATITDPNYSGSVSGTETITITALVRHAPTVTGSIDGSVQMLSAEPVTLSGSAWISGDLLVPATPNVVVTGSAIYGGTIEGTGVVVAPGYDINLSGTSLLRHVVRRTDPIGLPTVAAPALPVGTRIVSLTAPGQSAGDFATLRNLSLNANAGLVTVPPGTYGSFSASGNSGFVLGIAGATTPSVYNFQSLALNVLPGTAQLQVIGPVIVTLANGSLMNGAAGTALHPEWLMVRVATGGLTISGNVRFNGNLVAPNSTLTINGTSVFFGTLIADRLAINGTSALKDPVPPVTSTTSDEIEVP